MAVRNFDRKFGPEFLESLPGSPGVYLVYDRQEELIYVGKAKNLKRRLSQYRNTLRRKKHRPDARDREGCRPHRDPVRGDPSRGVPPGGGADSETSAPLEHRGRVLVPVSADRDP